MKGGIFSISETLIKIISVAYVATVILSIFFAINQYHLIFLENRTDRETLIVGNTILSSCIAENSTGYLVKGLLSKNYIEAYMTKDRNIDCLVFYKGIYIEIYDASNQLLYGIGNSNVCEDYQPTKPCKLRSTSTYTTFPAALNTTTNIIHVLVNITLGV